MLNVVYYFYDHLNPDFPEKEIVETIKNKDHTKFMKYYLHWKRIGENQDMCYLPSEASVNAGNDYDHFVSTDILQKSNFEQITHCECECG